MASVSAFHVCVVGLGSMGMGAAKSCVRAGLQTYGIDLNEAACAELKQAGAVEVAADATGFADKLDAVLLLVVNAAQCKAVLFGDNALAPKLKPGTAVMVSATISADEARSIEAGLKEHGLIMLDAPVSGGSAKAAAGEMTVMASGSPRPSPSSAPFSMPSPARCTRSARRSALAPPSRSSISFWPAFTSQRERRRWPWPPAPVSRST